MKTIKTLIEEGSQYLRAQGIESPRLDAEVLLESLLHCGRIAFYTDPNRVVEQAIVAYYEAYIKRRAAFEPVAYITGTKEFMGLSFKVTPAVLIPRPDTESVVEAILETIVPPLQKEAPLQILDLCTGSGAIGLTLKHFIKKSILTLSDLSEAALNIAKENTLALGCTDVSFVLGDLFAGIKEGTVFDLIVSNPPYIPEAVLLKLQKDILDYEPRLALSGGESGYVLYERIAASAAQFLKTGGALVLEIGNGQENHVAQLLREGGFEKIQMIPDLTGAVRGVAALKK